MSLDQLLTLLPPNVVKSHEERKKTSTVRYEALNVFISLWRSYI